MYEPLEENMPIQHQYNHLQRLLPPAEVADLLGVTVNTLEVWRSTNRYRLPYIRVGRKVMYEPGAVQAFIDERRTLHTGEDVSSTSGA